MTSYTQRFLVVVVKIAPRVAQSRAMQIQNNPQKHMQCNGGRVGRSYSSIMCITERTSSDISDKTAFTPPGHIKRQQCKSKEAFFFAGFF